MRRLPNSKNNYDTDANMITILTPNDQLLKEFNEELPKAFRWLTKCTCKASKVDEARELIEKCYSTRKPQVSTIYDYQPKSGNKWKVFYKVNIFKGHVDMAPVAFAYSETIGSIRVFAPLGIGSRNTNMGVTIFTSHFFHRWLNPERDKVANVTMDDVVRFMTENYAPMIELTPDGKGGYRIDVRVEGGIARGKLRTSVSAPIQDFTKGFSDAVFEIRTFLTDKQLSDKQQRFTERLRDYAEDVEFVPMEIVRNMGKDPNVTRAEYDDAAINTICVESGLPLEKSRLFYRTTQAFEAIVKICSKDDSLTVSERWDSLYKKISPRFLYDWLFQRTGLPTWREVLDFLDNIKYEYDHKKALFYCSTLGGGLDVTIDYKSPFLVNGSILPTSNFKFTK